MARDDFDMDWGDDPFAGEIDFDMDFNMDPFAKKSFIGGLTTGFLSGLVTETVGTDSARMRTARTILPSSFNNALDKVSFVKDRIEELSAEFKAENSQTVKSLQSIAGSLNKKMGSKLPGFMGNGLVSFSQKDFSSWEGLKSDDDDDDDPTKIKRWDGQMENTDDDEISHAIDNSVTSQSMMFGSLAESLNGMTAAATASIQSSIGAGNRQLVNIESSIKDLLAYQRNIQAKMDQSKLNLMARSYIQDAKFYKFMEAGMHEEIMELKRIVAYSKMSDFQKTSTYTASKQYLRNKMFQTAGNRLGGLTGALRTRFSEGNRKEAYGVFGTLIDTAAQAMEVGDGSISKGMIGNVLGKMAAGTAVEQLPIFFTRGPGKRMVDQLIRKYPDQGNWVKEQVKQITDLGNIVSYASTSGMGILNSMTDNWEPLDEQKFSDYEDYVASLEPGQKPMNRRAWQVMNAAGNKTKETINKMMADVTKTRGTQYVVRKRDAADLDKPGIWKEINNITLNEVLPGLLGRINTNLEKMRTGNDQAEGESFNYIRGQFQTTSERRVSAAADLMPHADFQQYASSALRLVDELDPDKQLTTPARKALALQIAKDIDAEKGFNPYYYLGDIPGMSKSNQQEIQAVLMKHFGISSGNVSDFQASKGIERAKIMMNMPTSEGRERLNNASAAADTMKKNYPNVAKRIDLLRATGNEQMLRDMGVIYTVDGIDRINMQVFQDRFAAYMDNPDDPVLKGMSPPSTGPQGNSSLFGGNNVPPPPTPNPFTGNSSTGPGIDTHLTGLNETLAKLNESVGNLNRPTGGSSSTVNFDVATGELTDIKTSNRGILDILGGMNSSLGLLLDLAQSGKLMEGKKDRTEERQEQAAKDGLIQRFRKVVPSDMMGKGVDLLMRNNPLIMGGLLGGLGASFASNPLMAASLGGLGLMAGAYVQWKNRDTVASTGAAPGEDEDILDDKGEPLLSAAKKNMGHYIDASTKQVIKTWSDVKGPVFDAADKVTIGAKDLAGKIFGPDGRQLALKGLKNLQAGATNLLNFVDPLTRIKDIIQGGKDLMYQKDIYIKGQKDPVLRASKFKDGSYYIRDEGGNFKPIFGWNEINGAVYDDEGNQLVTEDEYNTGLVTAAGVAVRNLGTMASGVVGTAAGMGKAALDWGLQRAGYNKADGGQPGGSLASRLKVGDHGRGLTNANAGVEKRLDKIYRMMSQYMDIAPENDPTEGQTGADNSGSASGSGFRLNSLAWKAKKKEKDEKHKVNEAIINISENMSGLGKDKDEKKEKKGILGTIMGMASGLGKFAMGLVKNPIGTLGGLLMSGLGMAGGSLVASMGRLGKIGSALFGGVLGVASPIYNLLKWGFKGLAGAFMGRKMRGLGGAAGGLGDIGDDGVEQRGQSGKKKKGKNAKGKGRAKPRRRMGRGLMGTALTMGAMAGAGSFLSDDDDEDSEQPYEDAVSATRDSGVSIGERDPNTGHYRTMGDAATEMMTDWLPQGMVVDAIMQKANGETVSKLNNYGMFWTSDKKFFFKRDEAEAHEDEIKGIVRNKEGYGTAGDTNAITKQKEIRFAMYGVPTMDTSLARRIMLLEKLVYPYVVIRNNRGSFKQDMPVEEIMQQFMNADPGNWRDKDSITQWFIARFKPVYLIYTAAISVARLGDILEFDKSKLYEVVQVIERVQTSIATLDPYPYNIDTRIDSRTAIMGDESTKQKVQQKLEELKSIIPSPVEPVEKIASSSESATKALAGDNKTSTDLPTAETAAQDALGAAAARASQESIADRFKTPAEVSTIDVSDMVAGKDKEMDPFVMARLATYGNIDNMSWRVEAVLRLERYIESFIMVMQNDARFTGKSGQILELFKPAFRITSDIAATNWLTWFRDRFLPVMMTYTKEVKKSRGTTPERGWKQLTATNKAILARQLTEQIVTVDDKQIPVWEVEASPFPNSKSGKWSDRADKYLKILDAKAQEARLKDPEMEDEKSKTIDGEDPIQRAQAAKQRADTDKVLAEVYGNSFNGNQSGANASSSTSGDSGFAGFGGQGGNSGGMTPNATMSAPGGGAGSAGAFTGTANENFNPEFIKMAGEDKGIKMSLDQGEQLMLNHLVKAGFRDNKVLALALAMAKKETGGYSATVENTNWSAPTLLKYFKNIPDQATAQKVAAMSPAERAMYVYGRAPKGPQLGNTKPEDGWLYRGRGLFQLTGKSNYEQFKKETGIDVVNNPRLVSEDPNVMAESAVRFLKNNKAMLSIAKTGDFETAVRGINGGNAVPATDERRKYYNDYLNRLRSGDLELAGGTDDTANKGAETPAPDAAPETPTEPDKNVPQDHVDTTKDIIQPTGANAVKDLIAQTDAGSAPSNAGAPPSTDNASSLSPANAAEAPAPEATGKSTPAPETPATGASSSGGAAAAAPPVKTTPVAKVPEPERSRPAKTTPDPADLRGQAQAQIAAASDQKLAQIVDLLKQMQNGGGGLVKM